MGIGFALKVWNDSPAEGNIFWDSFFITRSKDRVMFCFRMKIAG
jgi:hypothetical protein